MRIKNRIGGLMAAFLVALMCGAADAGETKTKILKYDEKGRVIGVEGGSISDPKKAKSASKPSGASKTFNPETSYEEGELIVINPPKGFSAEIRSMGYRIGETIKLAKLKIVIQRLRIPAGTSVPKAIKELRKRFPRVEIDANHQFDPSAGVEFPKKVARAMIRWGKVSKSCGKGVKIGMIDTGVDLKHPAFKGRKVIQKSFHSQGRKPGPTDHGTAVASIMVGTPEWGGLLPGASLYAANMFEINEKGRKVANAIGLLRAVEWLIGQDVDIINLSFAGADNKIMREVFKSVKEQKLVMVAAVGNWGRSDAPAYPAAYKGVVAVTAISDKGKPFPMANTGKHIQFAAFGVRVYTAAAGGGGRLRSGTSFATPFITALMGLEISKGTAKTPTALSAILQKSVKDLGKPGRDKTFGWGFVRSKPDC